MIRFAALPILTLCSALIVPRCMQYLHRSSWAALVGGYSTTFLVHFTATIISESRDLNILQRNPRTELDLSNKDGCCTKKKDQAAGLRKPIQLRSPSDIYMSLERHPARNKERTPLLIPRPKLRASSRLYSSATTSSCSYPAI